MKHFRTLVTTGLFVLLCTAGAVAQTIQTDYDHNFSLAKLKTFGFYEQERKPGDPLAASPINDRRIHDALTAQLQANGMSASTQPDFLIAYFVTTKKGLDIQDNRFGLFQRMGNINVNQVTEGTIVVVFVDRESKQEVWRGYATGEIKPKDLDKDVTKAVSKLVQRFKKDQTGQK